MHRGRLLVIDDFKPIHASVAELLQDRDYELHSAHSLKEGLEKTEQLAPCVALVDLHLPDGKGETFLQRTNEKDVISVMLSAESDPDRIIGCFRDGALNWIRKPVCDPEQLERHISSAFEVLGGRCGAREKQRRLEQQVDWNYWKGLFLAQGGGADSRQDVIDQLNTYLNQSGGIQSILEMVRSAPEIDGGKRVLEPSLFSLVFTTLEPVAAFMQGIFEASRIVLSPAEPKDIRPSDLLERVGAWLDENAWRIGLRKHRVNLQPGNLASANTLYGLRVDLQRLKAALIEVLVNAMKYSAEGDTIDLWLNVNQMRLEIMVLNPAYRTTQLADGSKAFGIPRQLESLVFEFFVKFHREAYEQYREAWPAGMGLTMVQRIFQEMGGQAGIRNVESHLGVSGGTRVEFCGRIPLRPANDCIFAEVAEKPEAKSAADDFELF